MSRATIFGNMKPFLLSLVLLLGSQQLFSQAISKALSHSQVVPTAEGIPTLGCGSHHFMEHLDKQSPGYLEQSNQLLMQVKDVLERTEPAYKKADLITIPVVFHVVYNNDDENLDDSVILNQLDILNKAFRHSHDDVDAVREEFKPLVGDADIEFELAEFDPDGKATTGIVRASTEITHFGGVLPYRQDQRTEIAKWVEDSFYNNIFRLTDSELGGSDEWEGYLNIWIGDMRIFEPKVNNFEEILFLALATNPKGHENWPEVVLPASITAKGVVMHYVTVGSNNPNTYPAPYGVFNSVVKQGKLAIHEVGHYLGLRHIWGDVVDCITDDFIDDTPLCQNQSNFQCPRSKNSCTDNSQGEDLPDMIENYMDYSSGDCQVAFTKGQIAVMREVYKKYRSPSASVSGRNWANYIDIFPNPSNGQFTLSSSGNHPINVTVKDLSGKVVLRNTVQGTEVFTINPTPGVYLLEATSALGTQVSKVVVE